MVLWAKQKLSEFTIALVLAVLIIGGFPAFANVAQQIETAVMPVTDDMRFLSIRETEDGTYFRVVFNKRRSCDFEGLVWYREIENQPPERIKIRFPRSSDDDSDSTRAVGQQQTGEWFAAMSAQDLVHSSFAIVRHRCHPLWQTVTEFYP